LTGDADARITPYGAWLRETKLNELPQFWNVLVGEMSIVGPRPEVPELAEQWPDEVKNEVLSVRPGITSPASVTFRNEEKMLKGQSILDDYLRTILPEKLRMDQLYVRNYSLIGDLDVIFMTLVLLLPGLRERKVNEINFYDGMLSRFFDKYVTWFILDLVVAFIAISAATLIWRISAPFDIGFLKMLGMAVLLAFLLGAFNTLFGLKDVSWRYASPVHLFDLAISTGIATFLFYLFIKLFKFPVLPVPLLMNFGFFCFFGFVAIRYRERLVTGLASRWIRWRSQSAVMGERVLVIGAGDCGQLAIWLLEKSQLALAFSIVGLIDDNFSKVGQSINGYTVLGTTRDLPEIIVKHNIGLVMFAITKLTSKEQDRILATCRELSLRVIMIPDLLNVVNEYFLREVREGNGSHG